MPGGLPSGGRLVVQAASGAHAPPPSRTGRPLRLLPAPIIVFALETIWCFPEVGRGRRGMTTDFLLGGITAGASATLTAAAFGVAMGGACALAALPNSCLSFQVSTAAGWPRVGPLQNPPEEAPSSWTRTATARQGVALGQGDDALPLTRASVAAMLAVPAQGASRTWEQAAPAGCADSEVGSFEAAILGCDEPATGSAARGVAAAPEGVRFHMAAGR